MMSDVERYHFAYTNCGGAGTAMVSTYRSTDQVCMHKCATAAVRQKSCEVTSGYCVAVRTSYLQSTLASEQPL
jgi:hypothetical protein